MKIVIASSNINKIRRLSKLLPRLIPNVNLTTLEEYDITPPDENNSTPEENLNLKLNYYRQKLNTNLICEDDVVELKIGNSYQSIININHFFPTGSDLFQSWLDYLQSNQITSGRLLKYYGLSVNNKTRIDHVVIPLVIITKTIMLDPSEKNILNHFICPVNTDKTFCLMTDEEKDKYFETLCLPVLSKLLS